VNGFSKGFAMTGWRLGYAAAPAPIAKAMGRMQSALTAGANQFVQRAAIAALEGPRGEVERMRQEYQKRRDMVLAGLRAIPGLRIGDIPATFYAFPDVSGLLGRKAGTHVIDTTDALCDWLLEQHGVATVPGTAFGAPGTIRLSVACSETEIAKAMQMVGAEKFLIEGHTCDLGEEADNKQLSHRRAQAVIAELARLGVPAERLQPLGFGEEKPLTPNHDEIERQVNRRVEIYRKL
jgi:histidinol-phosphate/aromatic aminotransferase/cobyric acid decarboxylase-like protein